MVRVGWESACRSGNARARAMAARVLLAETAVADLCFDELTRAVAACVAA